MPAVVVRPEQLPSRIRNEPRRRAEVKLYDALYTQMGRGWSVFYSVGWTAPAVGAAPKDGETDFIVAHPDKGILLIEVKGGRITFDERRRQILSSMLAGSGVFDHQFKPSKWSVWWSSRRNPGTQRRCASSEIRKSVEHGGFETAGCP